MVNAPSWNKSSSGQLFEVCARCVVSVRVKLQNCVLVRKWGQEERRLGFYWLSDVIWVA